LLDVYILSITLSKIIY